jgi:hypothetical protein
MAVFADMGASLLVVFNGLRLMRDDPDAFYARCGANLSGPKRWVFERIVRHMMNRNVDRIRRSGSPREAAQRSSLPEMTSK